MPIAMMLDWQGRVAECTGANIFFTKDGAIPHADGRLLPRRHHPPHRDRPCEAPRLRGDRTPHHADELPSFVECFITGSAAEVTPVAEIGPYRFTPGNISRTLMEITWRKWERTDAPRLSGRASHAIDIREDRVCWLGEARRADRERRMQDGIDVGGLERLLEEGEGPGKIARSGSAPSAARLRPSRSACADWRAADVRQSPDRSCPACWHRGRSHRNPKDRPVSAPLRRYRLPGHQGETASVENAAHELAGGGTVIDQQRAVTFDKRS